MNWPMNWFYLWQDPWFWLAGVSGASAIALLTFHTLVQTSINKAPLLEAIDTLPERLPSLSVIIPAYNEAANIADCMKAVLANELPEGMDFQLIVADDESTDSTLPQAQEVAAGDDRILVFTVPPRPTDAVWLGKNWACTQAVKQATGDYLLFLDADVRLEERAITSSLTDAQLSQADLLSCGPKLICGCFSEWLVQPLMVLLIAINFRFDAVNDPNRPDVALAAGPFMLFRRSAYETIGGHAVVAAEAVEDLELAKQIKQNGLSLRYLLGFDIATLRMYQSFGTLWEGWTKNFHLATKRNIFISLGAAGAIALLFIVPWLSLLIAAIGVALQQSTATIALGTAFLSVAIQLYVRLAAASKIRIPPKYLWLTWAGGAILSAIAIVSIIKTETGWGWTWRGRSLAMTPDT